MQIPVQPASRSTVPFAQRREDNSGGSSFPEIMQSVGGASALPRETATPATTSTPEKVVAARQVPADPSYARSRSDADVNVANASVPQEGRDSHETAPEATKLAGTRGGPASRAHGREFSEKESTKLSPDVALIVSPTTPMIVTPVQQMIDPILTTVSAIGTSVDFVGSSVESQADAQEFTISTLTPPGMSQPGRGDSPVDIVLAKPQPAVASVSSPSMSVESVSLGLPQGWPAATAVQTEPRIPAAPVQPVIATRPSDLPPATEMSHAVPMPDVESERVAAIAVDANVSSALLAGGNQRASVNTSRAGAHAVSATKVARERIATPEMEGAVVSNDGAPRATALPSMVAVIDPLLPNNPSPERSVNPGPQQESRPVGETAAAVMQVSATPLQAPLTGASGDRVESPSTGFLRSDSDSSEPEVQVLAERPVGVTQLGTHGNDTNGQIAQNAHSNTLVPPSPQVSSHIGPGDSAVPVSPARQHSPIEHERAYTLVESARLVDRATTAEMRVGVHTSELGKVEVQASLRDNLVRATVSVERPEVQRMFVSELPNLNRTLDRHQVEVQTVSLLDSGMQQTASQGRQDQEQTPQPQSLPQHEEAISRSQESSRPQSQVGSQVSSSPWVGSGLDLLA